ncbi:hypothetical protein [Ralstonia pseudosolanacearum]|uniref:hypothetical protein n=1 Tax=Ralstonia pseudosolanacearum TaxID=1310165 RepID=UPI0023D98F81|nr:hypothetical protein [Ralstonia pseudosolanacearum]
MQTQVIVVGSGKLATELLSSPKLNREFRVAHWGNQTVAANKSIVIHAGSGRELKDVFAYCETTQSPLIELATGSEIATTNAFPIVISVLCKRIRS